MKPGNPDYYKTKIENYLCLAKIKSRFHGTDFASIQEKQKRHLTIGKYLFESFAERQGFEPWKPKGFNGFRDRPDRPLRHLSIEVVRKYESFHDCGAKLNNFLGFAKLFPIKFNT